MPNEDLTIRLGLTGQQRTAQGIDTVTHAEQRLGAEAVQSGAKVRALGASLETVGRTSSRNIGAGLGFIGRQARYGATGLAGLAVAGTLWGLKFNAQVDGARIRFGLFTDDVDGLMAKVRELDKESATFGFPQLADAAAMLGNADVKDIPNVLRGAANAAAAGGRGAEGLQSIVLALSQIQNKGKVSQEEINQLNEAGAPGTQRIIQKAFGLTADQLQNIGGEGLDATKALQALTAEWTSGKMADAARRQGQSLGGQWARTTSNMQAAAGAATRGLADGLTRDILPASNRAIEGITRILGDDGLTDRQKLERAKTVIRRELGPLARDLVKDFRESGLADELQHGFETAMSKMATVALHEAPHVVGAFVDAWLGAGPWAKLISGTWLAHKLGIDKGALALLKGLGAGGGASGALGKTASRATPIPVWVVNSGPLPDGGPGGGKFGKTWRSFYEKGGKYVAPIAAAGAAGAAGFELGKGVDLHDPAYSFTRGLIDRLGLGAVLPEQSAAINNPATRAIRGTRSFVENPFVPITIPVQVNIGGRPAGKAVAQANAQAKARKK